MSSDVIEFERFDGDSGCRFERIPEERRYVWLAACSPISQATLSPRIEDSRSFERLLMSDLRASSMD